MALTLEDLIEGLEKSRHYFWKHVEGMTETQCDWQPYPACKNVRETLAHLILDDRMALESLQTGEEPDYESNTVAERDLTALRAMLDESHVQLRACLQTKFADVPLDSEVSIWGSKMKLGRGISTLSSEDYYHAGQVAYIRMATDPDWDYYSTVYGN